MRLGVRAEGLLERVALRFGWVPVPLVESHVAATLARSIVAGVELGVFDALAEADAGLHPYRPVHLRTAPGWVQQAARRNR